MPPRRNGFGLSPSADRSRNESAGRRPHCAIASIGCDQDRRLALASAAVAGEGAALASGYQIPFPETCRPTSSRVQGFLCTLGRHRRHGFRRFRRFVDHRFLPDLDTWHWLGGRKRRWASALGADAAAAREATPHLHRQQQDTSTIDPRNWIT